MPSQIVPHRFLRAIYDFSIVAVVFVTYQAMANFGNAFGFTREACHWNVISTELDVSVPGSWEESSCNVWFENRYFYQ